MSMFSRAFPIRAFQRSRSGYANIGTFAASLLAVGLIAFTPARAQRPMADISSATHSQIKHSPAFTALQEGRVDDAATILRAAIGADAKDGFAHQLLCRVYYAQSLADEAIHECELAVASPSANNEQASDSQLWLGRSYGLKARHAGPFAGYKLARKVQASFARAVELNPSSISALNDLGEYDVSAPFIVGGGTDKAQALAYRMMPRYPGAAHLLLARIAQSNDDSKTAEAEFRQEVAIERSPEAWIDLAQFYQTHKRPDEAVAAIRSALAVDRAHGPALVDAASILTAAHRDPELAERCLRDYLSSHAKSDAAPAFKVHLQLARLLTERGKTKEANREEEAAAALAPAFTRQAKAAQGS
jgi:tetratricopeptide (TPR) repeat protein